MMAEDINFELTDEQVSECGNTCVVRRPLGFNPLVVESHESETGRTCVVWSPG